MWAALLLIRLLILFSIYGAFLGSVNAQNFFNSLPLAVYWFILGFVLIVGFISLRKLVRVPSLFLIHLGCILILLGAMYGSEDGQEIQKKLFGIDKIRRGQMLRIGLEECFSVRISGCGVFGSNADNRKYRYEPSGNSNPPRSGRKRPDD
jgi:hypothetical protein